ncbi:hydroxyacid dehydrogenase [Arthrobacter sp. D2-10]
MSALQRDATLSQIPEPGAAEKDSRRLRGALFMPRSTVNRIFPGSVLDELAEVVDLVSREPLEDLRDPAVRTILSDIDVLITGWGSPKVDEEVLSTAPKLRAVFHTAGTVKGVISQGCWERGIAISSAAAVNAIPVAEYTMAMIVLANKRVLPLADAVRTNRGRVSPEELFPGLGNFGKRVGIIGASRIGRQVIRLLAAYDLEVAVADPFVDKAEADQLGVQLKELDELLPWADVVSLHAPSIPETRGMIDRRRIGLMRAGTTFINTARGEIVDQQALTERLQTGDIFAVLDVTSPSVLPMDSPLYDLPNVLLTPHIAGSLGSELARLAQSSIEELRRFTNGEPLEHQIKTDLLPITA